MSLLPRKITGILGIFGLLVAFILLFVESIQTAGFFLGGVILTLLFLEKPAYGLFALIILRQITDRYNELTVFSLRNTIIVNLSGALGIILVNYCLLYIFINRSKIYNYPLFKPILIFFVVNLFSFFYSINQALTINETVRILGVFLLFFVFYDLIFKNKEKQGLFLKAIIASAPIPYLAAFYQLITGSGLGDTMGISSRIYSTFSHPNAFAIFTLIIFAISLFYLFKAKHKIPARKLPILLLVALSFALLILTYGRGGILALLLFSLIIAIYRGNMMILVLIGFIFSTLFFVSQTVHDRVEDIYNPPADSSVRWRFEQWGRSWEIFLEKPIFGHGANAEITAFEHKYGFDLVYSAHNDYLMILIELGIIGLVSYLYLVFSLHKTLYLKYKNANNSNQKDLIFIVLALSISLYFYALNNNIHKTTAIQWIFWPLVAVVLVKKEEGGNKPSQFLTGNNK